jgi:hypothetical protein
MGAGHSQERSSRLLLRVKKRPFNGMTLYRWIFPRSFPAEMRNDDAWSTM